MTDKDFLFLQSLYNKARRLQEKIERCNEGEYVDAKFKFDELDPMTELLNNVPQRVKNWDAKIVEIRNFVLLKTNGHVKLPDETILGILSKATK